jgi:hypothetical protein
LRFHAKDLLLAARGLLFSKNGIDFGQGTGLLATLEFFSDWTGARALSVGQAIKGATAA